MQLTTQLMMQMKQSLQQEMTHITMNTMHWFHEDKHEESRHSMEPLFDHFLNCLCEFKVDSHTQWEYEEFL
jgi:hypothetical protein